MEKPGEVKLQHFEDEARAALIELAPDDFLAFAQALIIPSASGPQLYLYCMADFQLEFFEEVAPSVEAVRNGTLPPRRRWWLERTKKASKDTDIAVIILWLMAYATRPFLGQIAAANRGQAGIIEDRCIDLLYYNPWLNDRVEVVRNVVRSKTMKEARTKIEATGSAGAAQGPTPDLLVLNELVHVEKWGVMKSHMANAAGVPQGIAIVATNAGVKGTPAEVWRKNAISAPERWWCQFFNESATQYAYTVQVGIAPWLTAGDVADAERMDPIGAEYARLYRGMWVSGVGDALSEKNINSIFTDAAPIETPQSGWRYLFGLDLGISHDHAGLVCLGVNEQQQKIRVARMRSWEPDMAVERGDGTIKKEVNLTDVENTLKRWYKLFRGEACDFDPAAGGSFMAQRLRKRGLKMREVSFSSPTNLTAMATALVTVVKADPPVFSAYEDQTLRRDFGKFKIEHKPASKYRLVAVSDEFGHADVGTALVLTLPRAIKILGGISHWLADDDLIDTSEEEWTEDDVEAMPEGLRDIYNSAEGDGNENSIWETF